MTGLAARGLSPKIATRWFSIRSNRCREVAVIRRRTSQRSDCNPPPILSRAKFFILPSAASPSFCSGATYLVFIRTIEALRARGQLQLDFATLNHLIIRDQRDGEGIWGRWNANGPGTARLFHELGLGRNFSSFDQAKPGDFMKIFWSRQVGRREHGHSAIFLGTENRLGKEYVRYWSSNIPSGYGEKSVPRKKIAYAIFSRLQTPANLSRINNTPLVDTYLASLLRKSSSIDEAGAKCGL